MPLKAMGLALLVAGVILLIYGINASDSLSSEVSEFFNGKPTDKTMWLIIGGVVAFIVGLCMSFAPTGRRIT